MGAVRARWMEQHQPGNRWRRLSSQSLEDALCQQRHAGSVKDSGQRGQAASRPRGRLETAPPRGTPAVGSVHGCSTPWLEQDRDRHRHGRSRLPAAPCERLSRYHTTILPPSIATVTMRAAEASFGAGTGTTSRTICARNGHVAILKASHGPGKNSRQPCKKAGTIRKRKVQPSGDAAHRARIGLAMAVTPFAGTIRAAAPWRANPDNADDYPVMPWRRTGAASTRSSEVGQRRQLRVRGGRAHDPGNHERTNRVSESPRVH